MAIRRESVLREHPQGDCDKSQAEVISPSGSAWFDEVVMACHSDKSLALIHGIDQQTKNILAAVPYQKNRAIFHTDSRFLPETKCCWAAWNYTAKSGEIPSAKQPKDIPIIVSLNPTSEPDPKLVHQEIQHSHPVFDMRAIQAQKELPLIQGNSSIWYCAASTGFGFHEDGLRSGELVAEALIENIRSPLNNTPDENAR